jgi:hypothetical protein
VRGLVTINFLQINDSSIGFNENHYKEDIAAIVSTAIRRLEEEYK